MTYGTVEHEEWLIAEEAEDEFRRGDPPPAFAEAYGGCGCFVSQVLGGDCAHSVAAELAED